MHISGRVTVVLLVLVATSVGGGVWYACSHLWNHTGERDGWDASFLDVDSVELGGVNTSKQSLLPHYSLAPLALTLDAPQYVLPLQTEAIANYPAFSATIPLSERALRLLQTNGFVVIDNPFLPEDEDITRPYDTLQALEIPLFITSDSLLHLYHILVDETLRQVEEKAFYDQIWAISKTLFDYSLLTYDRAGGDLKEATRRNVAYFAVALQLLQPKAHQICTEGPACVDPGVASAYFTLEDLAKYQFQVPAIVQGIVTDEVALIETHAGVSDSPLCVYQEDYSQYRPRGHYTRSEKLKNYFKAVMWYGRMSLLLQGTDQVAAGASCDLFPPCKALISLYDAKIQTMQACLIAYRFIESEGLMAMWERIYAVTAFYVGYADDLGPYEYIDAVDVVFHGAFDPNDLSEDTVGELKAELAAYMPPEIYGGTGSVGLVPPFTPEQLDEVLNATTGFRLMGQRFTPDAYFFQNLVPPLVGRPLGPERPFTWGMTPAGPARVFPRGLDVMALLGSQRATDLLAALKDSNYAHYATQVNRLSAEVHGFSEADWNRNIYWSWLSTLKPLLKEFGEGYPTFMQTTAWQEKALTTALASWTELRHDTILYAKQSYTPLAPAEPEDNPVIGYVEPVPEFYNRLLALTRMTMNGLDAMEVLESAARHRLETLETLLKRLLEISVKELQNEALTPADYDFIKSFGDELNTVIEDVAETAKTTTLVADVHTDLNTRQVLEEGVGYVKLLVVAYPAPDGRILLGCGPVLSYYEFKQPLSARLTDEAWRDLLRTASPNRPEWTPNFAE